MKMSYPGYTFKSSCDNMCNTGGNGGLLIKELNSVLSKPRNERSGNQGNNSYRHTPFADSLVTSEKNEGTDAMGSPTFRPHNLTGVHDSNVSSKYKDTQLKRNVNARPLSGDFRTCKTKVATVLMRSPGITPPQLFPIKEDHKTSQFDYNQNNNNPQSKPFAEDPSVKEAEIDLMSHIKGKYKEYQPINEYYESLVGNANHCSNKEITGSVSLPPVGPKNTENDLEGNVLIKTKSRSLEQYSYEIQQYCGTIFENIPNEKNVPTELMGSIQLGIFASVSSVTNKYQGEPKSLQSKDRHVLVKDFEVIETISFPKCGSEITPQHNYRAFQFQAYSPFAFDNFRRQLYGIDASSFLASLCSMPMIEFGNPGKSGSFLYKSKDDDFVCKTVSHKEATFLQKLLAGYWMNLTQNPRTYLPKFYGLYGYSSQMTNFRIVVMNNLLPSDVKMCHIFDLKGSTFGRTASDSERAKDHPVFKDLDFLDKYPEGIQLDAETYDELINIIENDCRVLESFDIIDYSLLLGIHNQDTISTRGNSDWRKSDTVETFFPNLSPTEAGIMKRLANSSNATRSFQAKDHNGKKLIVYLGIIDVLQSFDFSKRAENLLKSTLHDSKTISVIRPNDYSERFLDFMKHKVFKKKDSSESSHSLFPAFLCEIQTKPILDLQSSTFYSDA